MTSQPISERTQGTERRPRLRRVAKKGGILPSFGDIVLPVVSVAAIALLVIAGRQFFINGLRTSPEIKSTKAYADAPALVAERLKDKEEEQPSVTVVNEEAPVNDGANMVIAAEVVPSIVANQPVKVEVPAPKKEEPAPVKAAVPVQTKAEPVKAAAPVPQKAEPAPKVSKPSTSSLPINQQWRVQIGAYGSKAAAQEAANKLKKAGYNAVVYSNPASKYVKVWVAGGTTKDDAEEVMEEMKKLGHKSSFVFPPMKK